MYTAVAAQRAGDNQHALSVLKPLLGRTVDPQETMLVLDTLGAAEEAVGDRLAALSTRDRELGGELSEAKRAEVEAVMRNLVQKLDPTVELPRAYEQLPHDGHAWPEVARLLLRVSHDRGDRERVSKIADDLGSEGIVLDETLSALVLRAERPSDADPGVIGAILPLSGRGREVGESALQGLLYASGLESSGKARPRLVYRDDAGDPARAVAALEDLVSVHRVIAVIGPLNAGPAQAVAERSSELGVPVIAISPDPSLSERSSTTYRLLPDPREEAALLVQEARRAGRTHIALLYPESNFGQAMRQAFEKAVVGTQASLSAIAYAPTTTNFVREAEQLEKLDVDAVVLADGPSRVALIAPALAAAGLWSVAPGSKPPEGRSILYLVPSAGFDPSLARTARRYLQGALFAVPFDAGNALGFSEGYRARFSTEPNLFSAAAHDAYRIVESGLVHGRRHTQRAGRTPSPRRAPRATPRRPTASLRAVDRAFLRASRPCSEKPSYRPTRRRWRRQPSAEQHCGQRHDHHQRADAHADHGSHAVLGRKLGRRHARAHPAGPASRVNAHRRSATAVQGGRWIAHHTKGLGRRRLSRLESLRDLGHAGLGPALHIALEAVGLTELLRHGRGVGVALELVLADALLDHVVEPGG